MIRKTSLQFENVFVSRSLLEINSECLKALALVYFY